ncbi:hypothetical protein HRG_014191 [Hirsutella rhossiliensis]
MEGRRAGFLRKEEVSVSKPRRAKGEGGDKASREAGGRSNKSSKVITVERRRLQSRVLCPRCMLEHIPLAEGGCSFVQESGEKRGPLESFECCSRAAAAVAVAVAVAVAAAAAAAAVVVAMGITRRKQQQERAVGKSKSYNGYGGERGHGRSTEGGEVNAASFALVVGLLRIVVHVSTLSRHGWDMPEVVTDPGRRRCRGNDGYGAPTCYPPRELLGWFERSRGELDDSMRSKGSTQRVRWRARPVSVITVRADEATGGGGGGAVRRMRLELENHQGVTEYNFTRQHSTRTKKERLPRELDGPISRPGWLGGVEQGHVDWMTSIAIKAAFKGVSWDRVGESTTGCSGDEGDGRRATMTMTTFGVGAGDIVFQWHRVHRSICLDAYQTAAGQYMSREVALLCGSRVNGIKHQTMRDLSGKAPGAMRLTDSLVKVLFYWLTNMRETGNVKALCSRLAHEWTGGEPRLGPMQGCRCTRFARQRYLDGARECR